MTGNPSALPPLSFPRNK